MQKKYLDQFYKNFKNQDNSSKAAALTVPMMIISEYILNNSKHIFEKHELTKSEIDVLVTLHTAGDKATPSELSEDLVFTTSGISKVLKKLLDKELVSKHLSNSDKRSVLISLEQKGHNIVEECFPLFEEVESRFFNMLNKKEKETLEKTLKKILYSLVK